MIEQIMSRIKITNVKDNIGHDLGGLFCDVYFDKKKIGYFNDDGWGGIPELNPYSLESKDVEKWKEFIAFLEQEEIQAFINQKFRESGGLNDHKWCPEEAFSMLISEIRTQQLIIKWQANAIVFGNGLHIKAFKYKMSINLMKEKAPDFLRREIASVPKDYKILNTNLEEFLEEKLV